MIYVIKLIERLNYAGLVNCLITPKFEPHPSHSNFYDSTHTPPPMAEITQSEKKRNEKIHHFNEKKENEKFHYFSVGL